MRTSVSLWERTVALFEPTCTYTGATPGGKVPEIVAFLPPETIEQVDILLKAE